MPRPAASGIRLLWQGFSVSGPRRAAPARWLREGLGALRGDTPVPSGVEDLATGGG